MHQKILDYITYLLFLLSRYSKNKQVKCVPSDILQIM